MFGFRLSNGNSSDFFSIKSYIVKCLMVCCNVAKCLYDCLQSGIDEKHFVYVIKVHWPTYANVGVTYVPLTSNVPLTYVNLT